MKILLCLVSDQHVPNLISVHQVQPDLLVLAETERMKKKVNDLLNALRLGGLDFTPEQVVRLHLDNEGSLPKLLAAFQAEAARQPADATWTVNLTGGLKLMSIAAYDAFRDRGKLIYTDAQRPELFIDLATDNAEQSTHRLTIREFLAGYGYSVRRTDIELIKAEERAAAWANMAHQLAAHASDTNLLDVSDDERELGRKKGLELPVDRFHFPTNELAVEWLDAKPTRALSKEEFRFLTGDWLEIFVWDLFRRNTTALNLSDLRLGIQVYREGTVGDNEFDITYVRRFGLGVIECKSGAQGHDTGGEIFYKVEAVSKQFRALHVRSALVTTASNIFVDGQLKPHLHTRAENYGCQVVNANHLRQLAANPCDATLVEAVFFPRRNPA